MKLNKPLLSLIFFFSVSCLFSQTKTLILPKPTQPSPPGNIILLPGYSHTREQGYDTLVGKISKEKGLEIKYDIGHVAGNYALGNSVDKKNLVWLKIQKTNNLQLLITYLKDGNIYATFPEEDANFYSMIKTNEDLADFLITIMTYGSANQTENKKTGRK
jgi:hypothetical protein